MMRTCVLLFLLSSVHGQFWPFDNILRDIGVGIGANYKPLAPVTLKPLEITDAKLNIVLHGVNWFGFNNKQTMVDGLWAGGTNAACDFGTILFQMRLLGFNALRLPFTFSDLQLPTIDKTITCKVLSLEELYKRTRARVKYGVRPLTSVTLGSNKCNTYLPNGKTLDRFLWTIRESVRHGFYVIIDYHGMGADPQAKDPKWFAQQWLGLWTAIKKMPEYQTELRKRVIVDIINEPDSMGINWDRAGDLYLAVMKALGEDVIYMIEGCGQGGMFMNWGDGFVRNRTLIAKYGLSDPNRFFDTLARLKYKVIVSPHIYGPHITKQKRATRGREFYERLDASFGDLRFKYPIVIGEFGFMMDDDLLTILDLGKWLKMKKIDSWLYWNYASNGADTLNIVKNWQELDWRVLDVLYKNFNL